MREIESHKKLVAIRSKEKTLRQRIITALCLILRIPFALLNGISLFFRPRTRRGPQNIAVIKPCCLGDLLMTTPLLDVIHSAYPDARITYVAGSWSKVVPEHHQAISAIIDCGSTGIPGRYSLSDYMKLARRLRGYHFDLAFVLDRSPMMTLLPWLAGIPRRVGPDSLGRGFSLTTRVPVSTSPNELQHEAEISLNLARAIGLPVREPRMRFEPTAEERRGALGSSHMQVAILPGGGSNPGMELTAKRWPLDRYRELARRLVRELDVEVLLIGGPEDAELNARLLEGLDVPEGSVKNIAGKTSFGELAAQLERCALFIGNDSSPMHLAAAVGTPVIAIFGPTSPQEYGPYPPDDPMHVSLWHPASAQPCFFMGKMRSSEGCRCIESVTLDEVWQAVQQIISGIQSKEVAH